MAEQNEDIIDIAPEIIVPVPLSEQIQQKETISNKNITASRFSGGSIYGGSKNTVFRFEQDQGIWLGNADFNEAPFSVDMSGTMLASDWKTASTGKRIELSGANANIEGYNAANDLEWRLGGINSDLAIFTFADRHSIDINCGFALTTADGLIDVHISHVDATATMFNLQHAGIGYIIDAQVDSHASRTKATARFDAVSGQGANINLHPIINSPQTPDEGDLYADNDHKIYYWNDSSWIDLTADTQPYPTEMLMGAGEATENQDYWNFNLPLLISTDVPTGNFWTLDNVNIGNTGMSCIGFGCAIDLAGSLMTTNPIFLIGQNDYINFGSGKNIIVEWGGIYGFPLVGHGEQGGFGLASSDAAFQDYDDQTDDAVCFTMEQTNLYAHTANAGAGHTETLITGITLTNINTFRIEFDGGTNAKFYINGVLKATHTTNLPDSEDVKFGYGATGNSNDYFNHSTLIVPYVSIEK